MRLKYHILLIILLVPLWMLGADVLPRDSRQALHLDSVIVNPLVEVTATPVMNRPKNGMGRTAWGLTWNDANGDSLRLMLSWGNTDFGADNDRRFMRIALWLNDTLLTSDDLTEGVNLYRGPNSLKMALAADGELRWNIGATALAAAGSYSTPSTPDFATLNLFTIGSDLNIETLKITGFNGPRPTVMTTLTTGDQFPTASNPALSPQGVWIYLDRDNDPKWARPGGRYTLGVTSTDDANTFDIVYLDGAITNASRWKPGMIKGRLLVTPFERHYNLLWTDATFENLDSADECSAAMNNDGTILTLSFPLEHSTLRFYRP